MPASPTGFGNFFLDRNINMPAGYQLLGCPPGMQQPHMVGMAGMALPFSGIPGYSFIPYPHPGHMAHISNAYDMKAASSYHQALLSRGGPYYAPFRPMPADDPSRVTKVATRESTSALKAWLSEHLKNPYPTKGEKIMLAIVTKMSLTQVSTWFANARRRLKKENRVSWASKGKSDEEDEEDDGESEEEGSLKKCTEDEDEIDPQAVDEEDVEVSKSAEERLTEGLDQHQESVKSESPRETKSEACKQDADVQKPKIWSLAETATSDIKKPNDMKHLQSQSPDFGKWWAGWPSRETYSPVNLSTHDLLKQK